MARIHELSEVLANQIAAGEVVERPASVVKELAENSIDAKASRIDILVEDAGLKQIRIIDDGIGIESEDVEMAFKRHATSKILSREDLFKINTLGFRGEALPSISSVADVVMKTATKGKPGTLLHIKGGQKEELKATQSREGTEITVNNLFYNTPARLKYVKTNATELSKISDIVNRLALSHTNIAFSLSNNGKTIFQSAGNNNLQQTIGAIYGIKVAREMLSFTGETGAFKISGYTSLPKVTRAAKKAISILINGRYVKNFALSKAIIEGYGSKLMVGRYPITVLNIELDPLYVDVNVHPTKQEVRISDEDVLAKLIADTIYARISEENLIPNGLENLKSRKKEKVDIEQLSVGLNQVYKEKNDYLQKKQTYSEEVIAPLVGSSSTAKPEVIKEKIEPIIITNKSQLEDNVMKKWDERFLITNQSDEDKNLHVTEESQTYDNSSESKERFPDLLYIGQTHGTFLLAESSDGLYIIDQHAAQERVKYEYYRKEIGNVTLDQQNLLVPIILTYPTTDSLILDEKIPKLAKLGIIIEDFGQNSYIVRQHPTWLTEGQEQEEIKEIIDEFLKDKDLTIEKFRHETAMMISCKQSIKANHHLEPVQAKSILKQLAECKNPFNCPHGRPTLIRLTNKNLEKMFKRIQDPHETGIIEDY